MDYNNTDINLFNKILNNNQNNENNDDRCLISNDILTDNHIKLECGHTFNYLPLYNEVFNQKTKKLLDNRNLKINQIKCPYCRKIIDNLLPYYSIYPIEKIYGVNAPEKHSMIINKCQYIKKGNIPCDKPAFKINNIYCCNLHTEMSYISTQTNSDYPHEKYIEHKKLKVIELKEKLKEYGLKISGNKDTLINRILNYEKNIK